MESSLTKLELDAVLQLIQLSATSSSVSGGNIRVVCVNIPTGKDEATESSNCKGEEEGSVGEALSSTVIFNSENCEGDEEEEDEPLPRRKPRFGSLIDVYRRTPTPPINNRTKKRARF